MPQRKCFACCCTLQCGVPIGGLFAVFYCALVAAVQPEGSTDVVMLVGSSTANAWKKAEPSMRAMAGSFRIAKLRKTSIARKSKNDYRFEDQGGLNEKATDNVMNLADL